MGASCDERRREKGSSRTEGGAAALCATSMAGWWFDCSWACILNEVAGNSETNHQAIIEFNDQWYFIYHTGALPPRDGQASGGRFRRSVAVEPLYYHSDGRLKRVIMTSEGIQ